MNRSASRLATATPDTIDPDETDPAAYVSDWIDQRNRRSEIRSIYPDSDSGIPR